MTWKKQHFLVLKFLLVGSEDCSTLILEVRRVRLEEGIVVQGHLAAER